MNRKKTNIETVQDLRDRLPKNRGEWLQLCIKFTKRALGNSDPKEKGYLNRQLGTLEAEYKEWSICEDSK